MGSIMGLPWQLETRTLITVMVTVTDNLLQHELQKSLHVCMYVCVCVCRERKRENNLYYASQTNTVQDSHHWWLGLVNWYQVIKDGTRVIKKIISLWYTQSALQIYHRHKYIHTHIRISQAKRTFTYACACLHICCSAILTWTKIYIWAWAQTWSRPNIRPSDVT
jgi:hypothetical protein